MEEDEDDADFLALIFREEFGDVLLRRGDEIDSTNALLFRLGGGEAAFAVGSDEGSAVFVAADVVSEGEVALTVVEEEELLATVNRPTRLQWRLGSEKIEGGKCTAVAVTDDDLGTFKNSFRGCNNECAS